MKFTKRAWCEERLLELHPEALFLDGFDAAILGLTCEDDPRVVYDEEAMVGILVDEGATAEEAYDHLSYNVYGSMRPDPEYPIIIRIPTADDWYEG